VVSCGWKKGQRGADSTGEQNRGKREGGEAWVHHDLELPKLEQWRRRHKICFGSELGFSCVLSNQKVAEGCGIYEGRYVCEERKNRNGKHAEIRTEMIRVDHVHRGNLRKED
jgi:hypothetical protein